MFARADPFQIGNGLMFALRLGYNTAKSQSVNWCRFRSTGRGGDRVF
jgi:hypothetical protein